MTAAEDFRDEGSHPDDEPTDEPARSGPVPGLIWTIGVLIVWVILAVRSPTLTYHFAPLIAAAAWPTASRREEARPLRYALIVGGGSLALVSVATLFLANSGKLEGPIFWGDAPAAIEALIFAAVGAAVGVWLATRSSGLLKRLLPQDEDYPEE